MGNSNITPNRVREPVKQASKIKWCAGKKGGLSLIEPNSNLAEAYNLLLISEEVSEISI